MPKAMMIVDRGIEAGKILHNPMIDYDQARVKIGYGKAFWGQTIQDEPVSIASQKTIIEVASESPEVLRRTLEQLSNTAGIRQQERSILIFLDEKSQGTDEPGLLTRLSSQE